MNQAAFLRGCSMMLPVWSEYRLYGLGLDCCIDKNPEGNLGFIGVFHIPYRDLTVQRFSQLFGASVHSLYPSKLLGELLWLDPATGESSSKARQPLLGMLADTPGGCDRPRHKSLDRAVQVLAQALPGYLSWRLALETMPCDSLVVFAVEPSQRRLCLGVAGGMPHDGVPAGDVGALYREYLEHLDRLAEARDVLHQSSRDVSGSHRLYPTMGIPWMISCDSACGYKTYQHPAVRLGSYGYGDLITDLGHMETVREHSDTCNIYRYTEQAWDAVVGPGVRAWDELRRLWVKEEVEDEHNADGQD